MDSKIVYCFVNSFFSNTQREFRDELCRVLESYGDIFIVHTSERLAIFAANVKAEIYVYRSGVVRMRENMNYTPDRLFVVSKFFRTHKRLAFKFGKTAQHKANIKALANYFYANRLGNRGVASGDGWKYRGAGLLESTGRFTILRDAVHIEKLLGIKVINPDTRDIYEGFLDSYTGGILLGLAYWHRSGMWECESLDCSVNIINRWTDSREKRRKFYWRAIKTIRGCA